MASAPIPANKALLVNCLATKNFELILKEFTGDLECCNSPCYVWSVDNKYYTAKIVLRSYHLDENGKGFVEADDYGAVVIFLDYTAKLNLCNGPCPWTLPSDSAINSKTQFADSLADIWSEVSSQMSLGGGEYEPPAVCLLVTVEQEEGVKKDREGALQWCVDNGFELIEWTKQKDEDKEPEGVGAYVGEVKVVEVSGAARLAEALQAHVWPHITMKSSGNTTSADTCNCKSNLGKDWMSADDMLLAQGLDGETDEGEETFEQLFAKFSEMKAHAQQLPHEQRKDYAEKVVLAFWDAIGGDKEEVKDL